MIDLYAPGNEDQTGIEQPLPYTKEHIIAIKTSNASPERAYTNMTPLRTRSGEDELRTNFSK